MSKPNYYEYGYVKYNNYYTNFNPPRPKVGTATAKKYSDEYKGLCILRYHFNDSKYFYTLVGIDNTKPFYIINPNETFWYNVATWCNNGNSSLYVNNSEIAENLYPEPVVDPTQVVNYSYVFWGAMEWVDGVTDIYETTLPIFTITSDDYEAFNNYIINGDDRGADNYNDLPHEDNAKKELFFKTLKTKGIKGNKGDVGICDEIPAGSIIAYDGEEIPEGYEEIESPV